MTALPRSMTDIAAELRRQLDESESGRAVVGKHLEIAKAENVQLRRQVDEVNTQVEEIRGVLLGIARDHHNELSPELRDWAYWYAAWKYEKDRNAEMKLTQETRAKWLRESGEECTRLQTEVEVQRGERNSLASQLDATQSRCDSLDREIDRRDQRIAALEAQVARLSETITSREVD